MVNKRGFWRGYEVTQFGTILSDQFSKGLCGSLYLVVRFLNFRTNPPDAPANYDPLHCVLDGCFTTRQGGDLVRVIQNEAAHDLAPICSGESSGREIDVALDALVQKINQLKITSNWSLISGGPYAFKYSSLDAGTEAYESLSKSDSAVSEWNQAGYGGKKYLNPSLRLLNSERKRIVKRQGKWIVNRYYSAGEQSLKGRIYTEILITLETGSISFLSRCPAPGCNQFFVLESLKQKYCSEECGIEKKRKLDDPKHVAEWKKRQRDSRAKPNLMLRKLA